MITEPAATLERIEKAIRKKHPKASEKQVQAWVNGAIRRIHQKEVWGFSPIR